MKTQKMTLSLLLTAALLAACGPKVQVPPRLDLRAYQTIGFINFESRTEGNFDAYLNDRFLEEISFAQPGADILELGPVDSVLAKVGYNTLDRDAIRELGREYGLDAIIVGTLDISNIKPHVHVLHLLRDVSVRAEVDAKIKARLIDVERGTTRWTAVARDRKTLAFYLQARAVHFSFMPKIRTKPTANWLMCSYLKLRGICVPVMCAGNIFLVQ